MYKRQTTFCVGFPSLISRISNLIATFDVFLLWKNMSIDEAYNPPSCCIKNDSATGSINLTDYWDDTIVSETLLLSPNTVVDITGTLVDVIVFCRASNNPLAV